MNKKIFLAMLGVLAVGLVALPSTLAMFQGQHNFYDTTTTSVPCQKCHADVQQEIMTAGSAVNGFHATLDADGGGAGCNSCHATVAPPKEGILRYNENSNANATFHAAADPLCLDCHGSSGPGRNALLITNGTNEVHTQFYAGANASQILRGGNAACIGCHTHVGVNITWSKFEYMNFNATEYVTGVGAGLVNQSHSYNVSDFNATNPVNICTSDGNVTCDTGIQGGADNSSR